MSGDSQKFFDQIAQLSLKRLIKEYVKKPNSITRFYKFFHEMKHKECCKTQFRKFSVKGKVMKAACNSISRIFP